MTSTEVALRDSNGHVAERDVVDGWLAVASDVIKLANVIASTDFVPEAYRNNAPAVAAAILSGRELGIGPMTALRHVQVVKGTPTLSAEYKRARVLAAGHEFDILELNTTRCKVSGRRRGSNKPPLEVTFTIEDARKAGLVKDKGAWLTRPRRMLFARAGSELCDFLFADITNGLPTAEVVADGLDSDELPGQEPQSPPAEAERPAGAKTAHRRARTAASKETYVDDGTLGINLPKDQQTYTGPPLPDEVEQPEPRKDGATTGQVGIIRSHFKRLGFDDDKEREQRLKTTARLAGRDPIESTKDLTADEALKVSDTLARCKDRGRLVALLATGEQDPMPDS